MRTRAEKAERLERIKSDRFLFNFVLWVLWPMFLLKVWFLDHIKAEFNLQNFAFPAVLFVLILAVEFVKHLIKKESSYLREDLEATE